MSLSEREQRILDEIERDLAAPEPQPGRVEARLRVALRGRALRWRSAVRGNAGWVAVMIAGLLAGIGLLSAGLVAGVLAMAVCGAVLTQLCPVSVGWLARWQRGMRLRRILDSSREVGRIPDSDDRGM